VNVGCSRAERVFKLEHIFDLKSFATVLEAFGIAFPVKEVQEKRIDRLITLRKGIRNALKWRMLVIEKVMDILSVCCKTVL
jgi:hypothetical protein